MTWAFFSIHSIIDKSIIGKMVWYSTYFSYTRMCMSNFYDCGKFRCDKLKTKNENDLIIMDRINQVHTTPEVMRK